MSSNEEEHDRDGLATGFGSGKNIGLIRTGVLTAAILIAILYSRSCFVAPPVVPPAPVEVAEAAPLDAPFISGIRISGDSAEINGRGEPGETVELFLSGNRIARTTVDSNGQWSYLATGLAAGAYEAVASHQGRAFDQSGRINFTIDEAASSTGSTTETAADSDANSDSASSIQLVKPTFGKDLADSSYVAGLDLLLTGNGTPNGTHILYVNGVETAITVAQDNGDWLFTLPEAAAGEYELRVVSIGDGDDQLSSDSLSLLVSGDTTETTEAGSESDTNYSVSVTEVVAGGDSDTPVTISGEGTPGQTFAVYVDDVLVHSGVVGDDGSWSFSGIMPAGPHTISAQLFENGDGDVSGEAVATAEPVDAEIAEARSASTVNSGRNGLFRILFGSQAAGAGEGDSDADSDAGDGGEGDSEGALAGAPAVELIVDASWSMTFPLDSGEEEDRLTADDPNSRIAIAQAAMVNLVENTLPEGVPVAVRAFGNIEGNLSCRTDLMSTLQPLDRENVSSIVGSIEPQFNANTAIAAALSQVSNDLADTDREKIVVLLTDGQETCGGDPAAVIEQLAAEGTRVSLNIIGFAILDDELKAQFQEWAELGNGEFFDASDADLLNTALEGAMTVGYTVRDLDGNFVARGVVGGQFLDLDPGVYNISNSAGDVVYENVIITPGSVSALPGG